MAETSRPEYHEEQSSLCTYLVKSCFDNNRALKKRRIDRTNTKKSVRFDSEDYYQCDNVKLATENSYDETCKSFDCPSDESYVFKSRDLWIQEDEYKAIRLENMKIILELKNANGIITDIDELCLRGLENVAAVYVYNKYMNRQKLHPRRIVQYQKLMGMSQNPDILSILSQTSSQQDQMKAQEIAMIDASA